MVKKNKSIKQMKTIAIVFAVVILGVGLFDVGFSYLYKGALEKGSCNLCFELNPAYAHCENSGPVNLSRRSHVYTIENIPWKTIRP